MSRSTHRPGAEDRGQTLVEFALVIPVVLLVFMAIFDLGRMVFMFNAVSDAARNGVREAIVNQDCGDVTTAARSSAPGVDLSGSSAVVLSVYRSEVVSGSPDVCPSLGGAYGIGYLAQVKVQTTYRAITPIVGQIVGPIMLTSTARLPIERAYP